MGYKACIVGDMSELKADSANDQIMLVELIEATARTEMLERDLAITRYRRDDLILDLLGTKASRKDISTAAGLAEISIYKIAARVRERRAALAEVPAKKARVRKKKVEEPVAQERTMDVPAGVGNVDPEPVIVEVPEGSYPLLGWTLAAA